MRTMDRCQRKPGCENLADRDGCEETQGVREKQKAKSHMHGWREMLQSGREMGKRQELGRRQFRGKGEARLIGFCDWSRGKHGPLR